MNTQVYEKKDVGKRQRQEEDGHNEPCMDIIYKIKKEKDELKT